jgi:uncharacterized protein with HEPN domain
MVADILVLVNESIALVEERFEAIRAPEDFVESPEGLTLLDSIAMRLQVIGESVKKIMKLDALFLDQYKDIEWVKIAKLRDLVSHHYDQVDHEILYDICKEYIPRLKDVVGRMLLDASKSG